MSNTYDVNVWPRLHIQALRASGLLHSAHHEKFDPYISLVRRLLGVPVAVISLIEVDRQIFAGHQGLPKQWAERGETPLTHSFCQHVVARDEVLRVSDAREHPLLKTNMAISDLGVIAYLGVPLKLPSGETVGALAAIDSQPRQWTEAELEDLHLAASLVIDKIGTSVADVEAQQTIAATQEFSQRRQSALIEIGDRLRIGTDIDFMVEGAGEVLGHALNASRVGYGTVDAAAETIEIYRDWHIDRLQTVAGIHHFRDYGSYIEDLKRGEDVIILDVTTDTRTRDTVEPLRSLGICVLINIPLMESGRLIGVMLVHYDRPVSFGTIEANFVRAVADRTHAAIRQAQSIAADKLREAEIGHRLKNTMAMVQAIATQTLKGNDIEERRAAFTARLAAMANAHDILMNRTWEGASLRQTLESALRPHGADGRVNLTGPEVELDARQAMSMSLAVHELATNATKYGALSLPGGTVQIDWSIEREKEELPEFRWSWRESGGPPVVEPTRKGFGSRLISRVLPNDFGGSFSIQYQPQGISCNLVTAAAHVGLDQARSEKPEANA